tara:strand:- start:415 stop:867 length:453 start_codon:yes stop_codon:yes gene_type:complete
MPDTATHVARSITIEYGGTLPRALGKNRGNKSHWRYRWKETTNLREVGEKSVREAWAKAHLWVPRDSSDHSRNTGFFPKATIEVTQYWCGTPMDVSGLASASAPLVDAFMDAGVIEDDGPAVVVETRYAHVRVPHRPEAKIVVTCKEVLA